MVSILGTCLGSPYSTDFHLIHIFKIIPNPSLLLSLLLLLLSHFSCVRLCVTPETTAHQAPCPWDSSGKNTGVGCHFLLQCMKVKSESEVAQSCPTPSDPMDCSLPGSSVHGIFQARVLEWGATAFSVCYPWYPINPVIFWFSVSRLFISGFLFKQAEG